MRAPAARVHAPLQRRPVADEPSGIVCDGTELVFAQERSVVGKRIYDANGDLVQRHFREYMGGTFTNPDTGKAVPWEQHDTIIHNLVGARRLGQRHDPDHGGLITRAWLPGGGSILLDAGTILEDFGTGDLIHEGGPHPFRDYFVNGDASALQPLCDALD